MPLITVKLVIKISFTCLNDYFLCHTVNGTRINNVTSDTFTTGSFVRETGL